MKNKLKYVVSLLNSSNDCVWSQVVSSRSSFEAVVSVVLAVSLMVGGDVYSRLKDSGFNVSVCLADGSDF